MLTLRMKSLQEHVEEENGMSKEHYYRHCTMYLPHARLVIGLLFDCPCLHLFSNPGNVAPHKRLRGGVRFVPEVPKNPSGKILRRVLREEAKKGNSKL